MFDIAFSELMIVGVVTLVVVGPKRLPVVARVAGRMFGQFNRYVSQVKSDVKREMDKAELSDIRKEFESGAQELKEGFQNVGAELSEVENKMQQEVEELSSSTFLNADDKENNAPLEDSATSSIATLGTSMKIDEPLQETLNVSTPISDK